MGRSGYDGLGIFFDWNIRYELYAVHRPDCGMYGQCSCNDHVSCEKDQGIEWERPHAIGKGWIQMAEPFGIARVLVSSMFVSNGLVVLHFR